MKLRADKSGIHQSLIAKLVILYCLKKKQKEIDSEWQQSLQQIKAMMDSLEVLI